MKRFLYLLVLIVWGCSSTTDNDVKEDPKLQTFMVDGRTWTYTYTNMESSEQTEQTDTLTFATQQYTYVDASQNRHPAMTWYYLHKSYMEGTRIKSLNGHLAVRSDSLIMGQLYEDTAMAIESYLPLVKKESFALDAPMVVSTLMSPYQVTYMRSENVAVPAGSYMCDIYRYQFTDDEYYTEVALNTKIGIISEKVYDLNYGLQEKRELKSYR
jgi:hypothetical protein